MSKYFFVTGTNTDIGKTFITAGLASVSTSLGLKTAVMKPVQTGTDDYPPDLDEIRSLAPQIEEIQPSIAMPFTFPLAASPHLAAREQGSKIDPAIILDAFKALKAEACDTVLVEGAGGIYVPIVGEYTMLNLIKELNIPVILVGTVELGAINHALLSIAALQNADIEIAGIILNKVPQNPTLIEQDNIETIERLGKVPLLATVKNIDTTDNIGEKLRMQLETTQVQALFK